MLFAGKYELEERLGEGAMGVVYRARHTLLGLEFAVKVLHPQYALDPTFRARFLREARLPLAFVHKRSVTLREFGVDENGTPYLTMDLCPGEPLASLLKRHIRLEPRRAAGIAVQVLEVLEEAHTAGILHRDVKPDNIMVDCSSGHDQCKVMDFGIAKIMAGDSREADLTRGHTIGTPLYMSPEQAAGERLDGRSDLYSLGVVLYEMVAGEPPFSAENVRALLMKHLTQPAPPLPKGEGITPLLEAIVGRALAKAPADRYASALEFRAALKEFVEGNGVVTATAVVARAQAPAVPPPVAGIKVWQADSGPVPSLAVSPLAERLEPEGDEVDDSISAVRPAGETLAPLALEAEAMPVSPAREAGGAAAGAPASPAGSKTAAFPLKTPADPVAEANPVEQDKQVGISSQEWFERTAVAAPAASLVAPPAVIEPSKALEPATPPPPVPPATSRPVAVEAPRLDERRERPEPGAGAEAGEGPGEAVTAGPESTTSRLTEDEIALLTGRRFRPLRYFAVGALVLLLMLGMSTVALGFYLSQGGRLPASVDQRLEQDEPLARQLFLWTGYTPERRLEEPASAAPQTTTPTPVPAAKNLETPAPVKATPTPKERKPTTTTSRSQPAGSVKLDLTQAGDVNYVRSRTVLLEGPVPGGEAVIRAEVNREEAFVHEGTLTKTLHLREGRNEVLIIGYADGRSFTRPAFDIVVDTMDPELELEARTGPGPRRGAVGMRIRVSAKDRYLKTVRFNEQQLRVEDGRVEGDFWLPRPEQKAEVVAVDQAGNVTKKTLTPDWPRLRAGRP